MWQSTITKQRPQHFRKHNKDTKTVSCCWVCEMLMCFLIRLHRNGINMSEAVSIQRHHYVVCPAEMSCSQFSQFCQCSAIVLIFLADTVSRWPSKFNHKIESVHLVPGHEMILRMAGTYQVDFPFANNWPEAEHNDTECSRSLARSPSLSLWRSHTHIHTLPNLHTWAKHTIKVRESRVVISLRGSCVYAAEFVRWLTAICLMKVA